MDDPPSMASVKEIIVDFVNRASTGTLSRGVAPIRCGLMMTSNDVLSGCLKVSVCAMAITWNEKFSILRETKLHFNVQISTSLIVQ